MTMADEPQSPERPALGIRFAPSLEREDAPPPVATQVAVHGGADLLTLEFFHVGDSRLRQALSGQEHPPVVTREDGVVVVRTEPVARVAVRFTVAAELLLRLVETALESVPELQETATDLGRRLEEIGQRFVALESHAPPKGPPR
jgi:hypothetical protein